MKVGVFRLVLLLVAFYAHVGVMAEDNDQMSCERMEKVSLRPRSACLTLLVNTALMGRMKARLLVRLELVDKTACYTFSCLPQGS